MRRGGRRGRRSTFAPARLDTRAGSRCEPAKPGVEPSALRREHRNAYESARLWPVGEPEGSTLMTWDQGSDCV